jgi:hypothetical protein
MCRPEIKSRPHAVAFVKLAACPPAGTRAGAGIGSRLTALVLAAATLGAPLAGCSDLYTARRNSIALGAGDAIAANTAMQTVDPWPPQSGNPNLPFDGQRMQAAVERYRKDTVTPLSDPTQMVSTTTGQSSTQVNIGSPSSTSGGSTTNTAAPSQQ